MTIKNIAVLASGNGTNFQAIIDSGIIVNKVLTNNPKAGIIERAKNSGHEVIVVDPLNDERLNYHLEGTDLIVLAGWMRIIKNPESFPAPMINVHPSLLPKYKGLHAVEQAMKAGEEYTGCTVHYVNEELDGGEIIIQKEVPILAADDVESLTKAVQRMEYSILPEAIKNVKYKIQTRVN